MWCGYRRAEVRYVVFFFYKLQKILNSTVLVWSCSKFTLSTDFINFKFETVCLHEYHLQGSRIKLLLIPVMDSFSSDIALQLCHLSLTFSKHNLTTILIWKLIFFFSYRMEEHFLCRLTHIYYFHSVKPWIYFWKNRKHSI